MTKTGFFIPPAAFEEKFIRAGGRGGQNVNKVATAVQLRFFPRLSGLSREVQERLKALAGAKLTAEGNILITAGEHRTQDQNRRAARLRLRELLVRAARTPKHRRPTTPSYGAKQRRLENKKHLSAIKRSRHGTDPG